MPWKGPSRRRSSASLAEPRSSILPTVLLPADAPIVREEFLPFHAVDGPDGFDAAANLLTEMGRLGSIRPSRAVQPGIVKEGSQRPNLFSRGRQLAVDRNSGHGLTRPRAQESVLFTRQLEPFFMHD